MDPITHGIAGALIGKAFFANRRSNAGPSSSVTAPVSVSTARVAIFAATLGAIFPDIDVFVDALSRDPLAIARYHRGFTHSFVGLPIFALALAVLTRMCFSSYAERSGNEAWTPPSVALLFVIYVVGIASHILLDGCTSFGTRMLNPFSKHRLAWDLLFIVDFIFMALLLVPQLAAWVHRGREGALTRAASTWMLLTASTVVIWFVARGARFPFSPLAIVIASMIFGAVLFLPFAKRGPAHWPRTRWCRAGFTFSCAYLAACGFAHHAALSRVRAFASKSDIPAEKLGALPLPVSLLSWNGLILTDRGVYQAQFSLASPSPLRFRFVADSEQNPYTREAAQLEPVRTFLWFARFPVMHFSVVGPVVLVEYTDMRFFGGANHGPTPFDFAVLFDSRGKMLKYGWVRARVQVTAEARQPANKK